MRIVFTSNTSWNLFNFRRKLIEELIDRNILYAKVMIKPARAIEYIVVDFVVTRSGIEL